MSPFSRSAVAAVVALGTLVAQAQVRVIVDRNDETEANTGFRFHSVPPPSRNDAATTAAFTVLAGRADQNGGPITTLQDGRVPTDEDQPSANFFFGPGTDGGRLQVDLGRLIILQAVRTYSWHPGARGPQVYTIFASDGQAATFQATPGRDTDPLTCGWIRLATVDTRPKSGTPGGQYGVDIALPDNDTPPCRYLLLNIARTEDTDSFGNTFYGEIDVIERGGPAPEPIPEPPARAGREVVSIEGGTYQAVIDTSETPDLTDWSREQLVPMVRDWYAKLVRMLPSAGYQAPTKFSVVLSADMKGVAATSGTRIRCAAAWIRANLQGEAVGAVFHEMVHVVQQYDQTRRAPGASSPPGWLVEGITDYLRWYHFEPQSRGAEITRANLSRARYDGSYRVTANFLNWVTRRHDTAFVPQLNAAIREGRYSAETWKQLTGQAVAELGKAWKTDLENQLRPLESTNPPSER